MYIILLIDNGGCGTPKRFKEEMETKSQKKIK